MKIMGWEESVTFMAVVHEVCNAVWFFSLGISKYF